MELTDYNLSKRYLRQSLRSVTEPPRGAPRRAGGIYRKALRITSHTSSRDSSAINTAFSSFFWRSQDPSAAPRKGAVGKKHFINRENGPLTMPILYTGAL